MRWLAALACLAGFAFAQEEDRATVRSHVEAGRFIEAEAAADVALKRWPGDVILHKERAKAIRRRAREAQRRAGYGAAIEVLEPHAGNGFLLADYAQACLWAGQEERGIARLRKVGQQSELRNWWEFKLLYYLRRYDEIVARADAVGDEGWHAWAKRESAKRARYQARVSRANWITWAGVAVILAFAAVVFRLAPAATR